MRRITMTTLAAVTMLATTASAQTGARVPDGQYSCQMWMGNSYVTLAARLAGGKAAVSTLAKAGATITGVTPAKGGVTINYTTKRGYRESMDCTRV